MKEITRHHEFSPSKLERIENCPPSWKICQNFTGVDGVDAVRGTLMHRAFYDDDALAELSDADKNVILEIRTEHLKPFQKTGIEHYHELYVEVKDDDGTILTAGTADYILISPDGELASLIDFKFGNYEVTPADINPQIWGYAAGVFQKFPQLKTVFALIVQPVYGIGDYEKQAEFKRERLPEIINRIKTIRQKAQTADISDMSQYSCSADNCRYCNKRGCPRYREWMTVNIELFGVSQLPDEVAEMTLDYADRVKCASKAIAAEIKPLTELADKVIKTCGGSANFRLCEGRISKKTDWKALCRKHGISEEDIAEFTSESHGEPYLMSRMRKSGKLLN